MQIEQTTDGLDLLEEDRQLLQKWIVEVIEEEYQSSIMKEMILPVFANEKGKKLRPLITLNTFRLIYGENIDQDMRNKLKNLCSALEISHNASLMIDDVFDRDIVRRGEKAFHVKFGTFAALSAGYNLSAFVFDLATRTDNNEIVREIGKVGTALSSALFMSKDLKSSKKISRKYFMDLLFRKTSALFVTSAKCGALLASDDRVTIEKVENFGEFFGTAYQLRDDVLAIIGNEKDLGKPPESDIVNRFQSLITIDAMEKGNEDQKRILKEFYLKNKDYPASEIREILIDTGAVNSVANLTLEYKQKAIDILNEFPDSKSKNNLINLLNKIKFSERQKELLM